MGLTKLENDSLVLLPGGERFAEERASFFDPLAQTFQTVSGATEQGVAFLITHGQLLFSSLFGIQQIINNQAYPVIISKNKDYIAGFMLPSQKDSNRVYVTLLDGLASIYWHNGKWVNEGRISGIEDQTGKLIEDDNGDLWVSTYTSGLLRLHFPINVEGKPDIQHP